MVGIAVGVGDREELTIVSLVLIRTQFLFFVLYCAKAENKH